VSPVAGTFPPENYEQILSTVNIHQGSVESEVGKAGQPIAYIGSFLNYLRLDSIETCEKVVEALTTEYPEMDLIKSNPAAIQRI
jgi:hypothetical protein